MNAAKQEPSAILGVWQSTKSAVNEGAQFVTLFLHFFEDGTGLMLIEIDRKDGLVRQELRDGLSFQLRKQGSSHKLVIADCLSIAEGMRCEIPCQIRDLSLTLEGGKVQWPDGQMTLSGKWRRYVAE